MDISNTKKTFDIHIHDHWNSFALIEVE
jgi:hypothetical protein